MKKNVQKILVLWAAVLLLAAGNREYGSRLMICKAAEDPARLQDTLPEKWYAGDYGKKPAVQNQGKYGTCWALTAVSAMESMLLPEKEMRFSADHLSRKNSFAVNLEEGGDYLMTMAYLSSWQGPVLESEDPYGDGYSPDGLLPAVHVQEIRLLENAETEELKKAVYQYGAVQTSLYMSRETTAEDEAYYNSAQCAYYYPEQMTQNHDVLILGWDDHFPAEAFCLPPEADGAFICQNTWGESFGEDGIFYVSYYDANLGSTNLVYSRIDSVDHYDRIYQNDECGWQGSQGYASPICWFSGVYTAVDQEELSAVGFYATAPGAGYEVWMVHDFESDRSFAEKQFLQAGELEHAGYYTVDLEEGQLLKSGERFAVAVKLTTPGHDVPVAVEFRANAYTQGVTVEGKESYLSPDGVRWENAEERYQTNVCLKAFTTEYGKEEEKAADPEQNPGAQ